MAMKTVGVLTKRMSEGLRSTLNALGEVVDVRFEERTGDRTSGVDALLALDADEAAQQRLGRAECPSFSVISADLCESGGRSSVLEMADHRALPAVLRGRAIETDDLLAAKVLPRPLRGIPLASKAGVPVWAMHEENGRQHHCVSLPIPELDQGEPLFAWFHGGRFLQLLPLLHFLRTVAEPGSWTAPPLQACFMLDDPNLHWHTYGFVDFAQIAEHARSHDYHVSFATIPRDAWFVHRPTAALFRQHRDVLSLLFHGNDHTAREFAQDSSGRERTGMVLQALGRIRSFERRSGLEVCRVMAPPHGACTERTLQEMARCGFEAACISRGSLRRHNEGAPWLRTVGMRPADFIGGLPVLSRFPLSGSWRTGALISVLLGQPIIIMGHHHDLASGLDRFAETARFVNSLGSVQWSDVRTIARSHYAHRAEGSLLRVRMFTRRIELSLPQGMERIRVEQPLLDKDGRAAFFWRFVNKGPSWNRAAEGDTIAVPSGGTIDIRSLPLEPSVAAHNERPIKVWAAIRRQMTEARDRLAPLWSRVTLTGPGKV